MTVLVIPVVAFAKGLFATSDAMITDCSSFLSEYLYSGNPGLFLTNSTQKFNEYGEIIKNAWYQIDGTDFKKIENFINDVVINEEDPLKTTRENIYNRYLKMDGLASEKIYNYIKSSLTIENELN
jgi:UDP-N-acetylglucosamine 2-epimerase